MTRANPAAKHRTSRLAVLQRLIILAAMALLLVAATLAGSGRPMAGALLAFLVMTGHAWFLGLEMLIAAKVNRDDPAPRADLREWLHAWWKESHTAPVVFAWRQPFLWPRWPDDEMPGSARGTVAVFIHGFVCNRGFWLPWMARCRAEGRAYVSVNLEPIFGSIDAYADLIENAVARAEALNPGVKPILVCHSMGGLAARLWLAQHDQHRERIGGVITIGSPHRGTWLAHFSRVSNGRQMAPGCDWLCELERREREQAGDRAYQAFLCWYTHTDNIVFPASTATLPGADNRHIAGAAHVDLAFHPEVMRESLARLASADNSPSERTLS
jgi:pimeloyl-ACP methyl ester carboxylesterase